MLLFLIRTPKHFFLNAFGQKLSKETTKLVNYLVRDMLVFCQTPYLVLKLIGCMVFQDIGSISSFTNVRIYEILKHPNGSDAIKILFASTNKLFIRRSS